MYRMRLHLYVCILFCIPDDSSRQRRRQRRKQKSTHRDGITTSLNTFSKSEKDIKQRKYM